MKDRLGQEDRVDAVLLESHACNTVPTLTVKISKQLRAKLDALFRIEISDEEMVLVVLAHLTDIAGARGAQVEVDELRARLGLFCHLPSSIRRSWSPMRT